MAGSMGSFGHVQDTAGGDIHGFSWVTKRVAVSSTLASERAAANFSLASARSAGRAAQAESVGGGARRDGQGVQRTAALR